MKALYRTFAALVMLTGAVPPALPSTRQDAMALEQQGNIAEAEQAWLALASADPRNAEALAHLGLLEARQQRFEPAIAYYRQAAALNAELPGLQMNLGLALYKTGDFKGALKPFTAELLKNPGDQRLTILLGMTHYGMGDYLLAVPYLQRAAERDPQNLPLRLTLAHSCLWAKQIPCVLETYKQILALNAESAEADMLAGEALDESGDNAGAVVQFRAAVKANPQEPNVHFGLGYLLWRQSQFDEAAKEFQAELENDATEDQARIYLADCYVELNDYAKAGAELEKVAPVSESTAMVHRDLGIVYASAGRNEEAAAELRKAIALDPKDVSPHWRLAKLYQAMGRKDEAKAEFATASAMNKESSQALYDKIANAQTRNAR
ncbi:MAG TPA: tetratricopeptide repeat protein [Acidisarcina sp.]